MRPNEPKGERKNMKMTFRWYGSQSDKITLKQIKQIPGCTGLMGVLDYKAAGEVWEEDEIKAYIDEVHAAGLECEVIESVNRQSKTIRYELARRVRYQLRKTPELTFYLDDSLDYIENIDRLLQTDTQEPS